MLIGVNHFQVICICVTREGVAKVKNTLYEDVHDYKAASLLQGKWAKHRHLTHAEKSKKVVKCYSVECNTLTFEA